MNKTGSRIGAAAIAGALVCCGPGEARATLGGDVSTIGANQQRLSGERTIKALTSGERHELRLPSGTVVREYVSAGGTVYAVSWHGHRIPDLQELLGSYFTQLSSHGGRRRGGRHHLELSGSDLVIESSGHGRSFSGRAWVPSLVPAGVDAATAVEAGQ